jgi:phytoene synthase
VLPLLLRSAAVIYAKILDKIENNGYDNFTLRAYVPKLEKMASLPRAYFYASLGAKLYELRGKGFNL